MKSKKSQHTRAKNKSRAAVKIIAAPPPTPHICASETGDRCDTCFGSLRNPQRRITGGSEYRKGFPVCSGFIDYFPDAIAEASNVSFVGNMKHNPGEPMHHARGKSMDHADCIARHLMERGGYDIVIVDGVEYRIRHSAALLWRAAALLQEELEAELALPLPRAARAD